MADKKNDEKVYEKAPPWSWKLLLAATIVIFLVVAGSSLWSEWNKDKTDKAKVADKVAPAAKPEKKDDLIKNKVEDLKPTGITLKPGEKIIGTKEPDAPAVDLVVIFPDGQAVVINKRHWSEKQIKLSHTGDNVKNRSAQIYYRSRQDHKYRFEKVSSPPAAVQPPLAPPTPRRSTGTKCSFNS